jgi:hypothetical protein
MQAWQKYSASKRRKYEKINVPWSTCFGSVDIPVGRSCTIRQGLSGSGNDHQCCKPGGHLAVDDRLGGCKHQHPRRRLLKIARPAAALGLDWGNCGDALPGDLFSYWQCTTLDNAGYGQGYVDVAGFTSVAVSASGLATIAYSETDNYHDTDSLKFATQWFQSLLPLVRR